jgi:hypothetical protein
LQLALLSIFFLFSAARQRVPPRSCVFLFFFFSFPLVYFSRHKKDELRLSISVPIPTTTVFASPPFQISGRESLGIIGG